MKSIFIFAVCLALDVWAGLAPVAQWSVEVKCGESAATLAVDPPQRAAVAGERYKALPVFNRKKAGWMQGERLNGVRAHECSVRYALDASSVRICSAADGRELVRGVDYEINPEWGAVGWVSKEKDCGAVLASYAYRQRRIDAVVKRADGTVGLRKGEPHVCNPAVPSCGAAETLLGTVFVDAETSRLTEANLFPVEAAANHSPLAFNPPERTLAKLRAGQKVKILAWGDSVTAGVWLKPQERWQEQFVCWLRREYPRADIELVSNGWGGRRSETFLREPPGSKYNFKESVLDVKPDLVISEFVNDASLKERIVSETYAQKLLPAFRERGIEWIILTPHYVRNDWMGLKSYKNCDDDPRPFVKALRTFAKRESVGLADAALLWGGLWRRGIPHQTLLVNDINHPNAFGMTLFVEALKPLFRRAGE
jgi:lysophospholipase L1-like esterase